MLNFCFINPRATAFTLASLCAGCVLAIGFYIQWTNQQFDVQSELQHKSHTISAIKNEVFITLESLNKLQPFDCKNAELTLLRRHLITTRFVADIGVLNQQHQWICTATSGLLAIPIFVDQTESSLRQKSHLQLRTYFDHRLPGFPTDLRTTLIESGQFAIAIYPFAIRDLTEGWTSMVQYLPSDGSVRVVTQAENVHPTWRTHLQQPRYLTTTRQIFDWDLHAFVQTRQVDDSQYLVQSVVTLPQFWARYQQALSIWAGMAVLFSMLLYVALIPVFVRLNSLQHRIKSLLVEDNIHCVYQPIVELRSAKVIGCEVLMRLKDNQQLLAPEAVLRAVQARHLTWQLDELVVKTACAELAESFPHAEAFKIAFNFFPSSISSGRVSGLLKAIAAQWPDQLFQFDIEVLEQEYNDSIVKATEALRRDGHIISVDDFGTGFSNLANIKAIAPDILKIDRSFVQDLTQSTIRSTLVPEIISIGKALGAKLVAEGIETEAQYQQLLALGVEFGQGYLIAKPMPIADFMAFVQNYSAKTAEVSANTRRSY